MAQTAADATTSFFHDLAERGHEPSLEGTVGSVRFDLVDDDRVGHWRVAIDRGDLTVTREGSPADAVVRGARAGFEDVASGRVNPMASALRGAISLEGDPTILVRFQRLFPSPTASPTTNAHRGPGHRRS